MKAIQMKISSVEMKAETSMYNWESHFIYIIYGNIQWRKYFREYNNKMYAKNNQNISTQPFNKFS